MRVFDSELLAQKGASEPVQSGMLFWLDGRDEILNKVEHTAYPYLFADTRYKSGTAVDRVNGLNINITVFDGAAFSQKLGCICVHNYIQYQYKTTFTFASAVSGVQTAELYIRVGSNVEQLYQSFLTLGAGVHYNPLQIHLRNASYISFPKDQMLHLAITSDGKMYFDGELAQTGSAENPASVGSLVFATKDCIGNNRPTREIDIGSIRYYNRVLTQDEILQNYQYELSVGRWSA